MRKRLVAYMLLAGLAIAVAITAGGCIGHAQHRGRQGDEGRDRHAREGERLRLEPAGRRNGAKTAAAANGATLQSMHEHRLRQHRAACSGGSRRAARSSSSPTRAATTRSRPAIAQQYKVPMITYDIPTNLIKGYVSNITTSSQEGAYLAGVLAAQDDEDAQARHRHLGLRHELVQAERRLRGRRAQRRQDVEDLRSPDRPGVVRRRRRRQARHAERHRRGRRRRLRHGRRRVVRLPPGDLDAKSGHKVWFIDDIGNMTPIDKKGVLLSSVLWDFTQRLHAGDQGHQRRARTARTATRSSLRTAASRCCRRSTSRPRVWTEIADGAEGDRQRQDQGRR